MKSRSANEDLFGELSLSIDSEHQYQLFFSKPILLSPSSFTQFNQAKVTDFTQPKLGMDFTKILILAYQH
jgi:hypothetical protein